MTEGATPDTQRKLKAGPYSVELGNTYMVKDRKVASAMEMFKSLLDKGFPGLCITGTFPKKLRSQYGLGTVKFIWISTTEGKEAAYNPKRLDFEISAAFNEFIEINKRYVVLLDGIELLVLANGFEKVMEFVKNISDNVSQVEGIFILPVNPDAFEQAKLAMLEQTTEVIDIPEKEREVRLQAEAALRAKEEEIERLKLEVQAKSRERKAAELELKKKEEERRKAQAELLMKEEERLRAELSLRVEEEERKRIDSELAMKEEERMRTELLTRMSDEDKKLLEQELQMRIIAWEKKEIDRLIKLEQEKIAVELERHTLDGNFIKCDTCKTPVKLEHIKKHISAGAVRPHSPGPTVQSAQDKTIPEIKPSSPVSEELKKREEDLEARKKLGSTIPFTQTQASKPPQEPAKPQPTADDKTSTIEEKTETPTAQPQHNCPVCRQKLIYFPQYSRWHCSKCNKWFAIKFDKDKK